jgi:hypothetical protein
MLIIYIAMIKFIMAPVLRGISEVIESAWLFMRFGVIFNFTVLGEANY